MRELKVSLNELADGPLEIELNHDPDLFEFDVPGYRFENVEGNITLRALNDDVSGEGEVRAPIRGECGRCLSEAREIVVAPFKELWLREIPDLGDLEVDIDDPIQLAYLIQGESLDLAEPVAEVLMSELPNVILCRHDCRGLCPGCGANLNHEACRCVRGVEIEDESELTPPAPEWKQKIKGLKLGE